MGSERPVKTMCPTLSLNREAEAQRGEVTVPVAKQQLTPRTPDS